MNLTEKIKTFQDFFDEISRKIVEKVKSSGVFCKSYDIIEVPK